MTTRDPTVAIIGAGIGGLSCARQLHASGFRVRVFDKGRGVGGRVSVRRSERGAVFDHGAQYFTVKDVAMVEQVEHWKAAGVVAPWEGRIGSLSERQWTPTISETTRYVGVPGMSAIAKHLAADLDVVLQCLVTDVARDGQGWRLTGEDQRDLGAFGILILNAPAPQSATLVPEFTGFTDRIRSAEIAPCWAVMLAFNERLDVPWDAAFVDDSPLSWIARNSSKPGRATEPDCWVLHASPEWSAQHLEDSHESVTAKLLASFWDALGASPQPHALTAAHRWRFALPTDPLEQRCLFDSELRLGTCGD
ncbi:MAG: FAD-dependent oxidoreductase [Pirellulaceae bacterium]